MPMLQTAIRHFGQDIQRAKNLVLLSEQLNDQSEHDDILRFAWMMAVRACDAYFCDAYGDLIARTLRAKSNEKSIKLPDRLSYLKIPVIAVIRSSVKEGWRWRMAARELIEKESVLSLEEIKGLFNQFCRDGQKIANVDTIEAFILRPKSHFRLFGISKTDYRRLSGDAKETTKKQALRHFEERFQEIFQRRNDCIHNCDRPKIAIQIIRKTQVEKVIEDIEFLVNVCNDILLIEFPLYLNRLGFSTATINNVCVT